MGNLLSSRRRKGLIEEVMAAGSILVTAELAVTVLLSEASPPRDSLTSHNDLYRNLP